MKRNRAVMAAITAGMLVSSAATPAAAVPRMGVVQADLQKAIFELCLGAQAANEDAGAYLDRVGVDAGLQDLPMNRQKMKVWRVSKDRRVTITPTPESCTATFNTDDMSDDVTPRIYEAMADGAVHVQPLELTGAQSEGWVFCRPVGEGFLGSYVLVTQRYEMAAEIGKTRKKRVRMFNVSVPRESVCEAA